MCRWRSFFALATLVGTRESLSMVQPRHLTRRQVLEFHTVAGLAVVTAAKPANAARGAAELDFEFYMRDLVGGNKKEGNIEASKAPEMPPPRTLSGKLLPLLLDEDCSPNCVPTQALIQTLQQKGKEPAAVAADIQKRVQELRDKSSRSFRSRSPWKEEKISDQYYFDFTSYAFWRTAADLLPDYLDRDRFVRVMGRMIYDKLVAENLIKPIRTSKESVLTSTISSTREVLEFFKCLGFCKGYRIRGDDSKDAEDPVFDELDDESIAAGGTVDCLVSVFEPATLGASLQITGEQSRFGPDFVGSTLAALWENAGVKSSWETFFVDPEYRPNPKDYFPNEQLIQFTLSPKS